MNICKLQLPVKVLQIVGEYKVFNDIKLSQFDCLAGLCQGEFGHSLKQGTVNQKTSK